MTVWVIVVNHFYGTYGTVHLTDAALLHHHLVIAYLSDNNSSSRISILAKLLLK